MTDELRSEILAPVYRRRRAIAVASAAGCALIAGGSLVVVSMMRSEEVTVVTAQPVIVKSEVVAVQVPVPAVVQLPPSPRSSELSLAFTVAGTTYVKIGDVDSIKRGKLRLIDDEGTQVSIATVAAKDLPAEYRDGWKNRALRFDTGCVANVTGFAVISRLTGSPGYSNIGDETWTAKNVFEQGERVLAARVAGCAGAYARDASLPVVVTARELDDRNDLVDDAKKLLLASAPAREAQRKWKQEFEQTGMWWNAEDTEIKSHVLLHPTSGAIWVSMHVHNPEQCGDPGGNIWGLFRVDANGNLKTVQLRADALSSISHIIDIEGDGELELIGNADWTTTKVMRADGETLQSLGVAFYGCGC